MRSISPNVGNSEGKPIYISGINMSEKQNILNLEQMGNQMLNKTANEISKQQEIQPATNQEAINQKLLDKYTCDELTLDDLETVLSTTVYEDKNVKIPLFLVNVLTFTEEEQRNVILTGESAVGKTHNINESLWYFQDNRKETIVSINDATPRALIFSPNAIQVDERTLHPIDMSKAPKKGDSKEVWEEWNDLKRHTAKFIDLSNKIVVFYDIPNFELLKNLRSLLSHDNKCDRICTYLVTDRTTTGSLRTKKILIKGYFTALFASAYGEMDEQETSRNYLLSPSDNPEKIKKAIELQAKIMTDDNFQTWYETEPSRLGLKHRVQLIREANIRKVIFKPADMESLKDWFFKNTDNLSPKAQRDFPRLYALAEAWALLNFQHRERTSDNRCIYANSTDIETAKSIYEPILKCNGLGLTPEEYEVWKIIDTEFNESQFSADKGLKISEIHNLYYYHKKRRCSDKRLRGMLKNFCNAGLIKEEKEGVIIVYHPITHKNDKELKQSTIQSSSETQDSQMTENL
jgi:hypothetical protein